VTRSRILKILRAKGLIGKDGLSHRCDTDNYQVIVQYLTLSQLGGDYEKMKRGKMPYGTKYLIEEELMERRILGKKKLELE
jgi:hypothetical protein